MARASVADLLLRKEEIEEQLKEARAYEVNLNKELNERAASALGRVILSELGDWKTVDFGRFREIFCSRSEKFADAVGEELSLMDAEKRLKTFEGSLKKKRSRKKNVSAEPADDAC